MRHAPALLALAVTAGLAAAPTAASAATSCGRLADVGPTGADPADAVSIRATVTTCKAARALIPRTIKAVVQGTGPTYRVGRYRCRERSTTSGRLTFRCTASGGRVVTWKLG